jgi:hypothetical protein
MIEIHFLKVKILSQKSQKSQNSKMKIDCSYAVKVKANVNPRTLLTCENWNKSLRGSSSKPKKVLGGGPFFELERHLFSKSPLVHSHMPNLNTCLLKKIIFQKIFEFLSLHSTHTPNIKISFHTHNLWGTQTKVKSSTIILSL